MKSILFCASLLLAVRSDEKRENYIANNAEANSNEKRENYIANSNANSKLVAPADSDGNYLGNGLGGDDDAIHGSYGCDELQDVSIEVYVAHGQVEITMKGPQGEWFGFGFGSYRMEGTYAIIAGEDCVSDYILSKSTITGDQSDNKVDAGLSPITVISDESDGFYRTIRIQRPRDHPETFSFPSNIGDYPIISAKAAYQTHRVAYHGNNRRPDRIKFKRVYQHAQSSESYDHSESESTEEQQYSESSEETTTTTTRAPTSKPTLRPTTAWPTERPTSKPTYKPTSRPITPAPTGRPTSASCCVPAPGQGVNGYQHAGRNHENPLKCTDVDEQDQCERLMNSRGEYRCDWASGAEFCAYQEMEAQMRDAAAAEEYAEAQRQRALKDRQEREHYESEMAELEARLKEESRRTEKVKEEDRQKHMKQLEEQARLEAKEFAEAQKAAQEAEEAMRAAKKALKEAQAKEEVHEEVVEEVWDGPSGECVYNGMKLGALKAEVQSLDAECAMLAEGACMMNQANCAWVGFSHFKGFQGQRDVSELSVGGVDVKTLLDMKVSTMDILLGAAVVITAAFALHQMCRWVGARQSMKGLHFDDEEPLLTTV